jgi:hypothetical protein
MPRHCEFSTDLQPTRVDETGWMRAGPPNEGDHEGRPYGIDMM